MKPVTIRAYRGLSRQAFLDGFTLVELMVVIGIIALLIAIVVPAVNSARIAAKAAATKATIGTIDTGVEQFRADSRVGGAYPPSEYRQVVSPHSGNVIRAGGASFVVWAVAGADLLGSPGFRDLNDDLDWANDTGVAYINNAAQVPSAPLYAIYSSSYPDLGLQGKPVRPRSGPYVSPSKMKFPTAVRNSSNEVQAFEFSDLRTKPVLESLTFVDSFGQPILYYKANATAAKVASLTMHSSVGGASPYNPPGIYNLADNFNITHLTQAAPDNSGTGMNLGGGYIDTNQNRHYFAFLGLTANLNQLDPNPKSFARTLYDPSVTSVPRPVRQDSFILISAGPNGIFGDSDDIANFELPK